MKKRSLIPEFVAEIKGFLAEDEGLRLFELALESRSLGPCLEIGSFCGKSTVYLGAACKVRGRTLFTIDHHRGSEEQQPGQPYFDSDLWNEKTSQLDSLPYFKETVRRAKLEEIVVPIIATSKAAARDWATRLGLVFIDGGHIREAVTTDYQCWYPHLLPGGFLVFHDVFSDPAKGGQSPFEVYKEAISSGEFVELPMTNTLGVLQRRRSVVIEQ